MEGSSFFQRLKNGLAKSREGWVQKLEQVLGIPEWDEQTLDSIEEILLSADVGIHAAERLVEGIRRQTPRDPWLFLQREIAKTLDGPKGAAAPAPFSESPWVVLFLGVNGVGKTTTIGKMAAKYGEQGKRVLLAAADTFRAAAIEQLEAWGQRVGAEVIKHQPGADPSAVVFDGLRAAKKRQADALLIDTAGRLHTKVHLVEELKKIRRVIEREQPGAPHETLLVLDATTGQNGLQQARVFKEAVKITGLVLTKLDGTAKGGIVIGIQEELGIPVRYIGVGEEVEDLQPFDPQRFAEALFERKQP